MSQEDSVPFHCADCSADVRSGGGLSEYCYAVRDEIWCEAGGGEAMLCIGCLEARLGRRLVPSDFSKTAINNRRFDSQSPRLHSRIVGSVIIPE